MRTQQSCTSSGIRLRGLLLRDGAGCPGLCVQLFAGGGPLLFCLDQRSCDAPGAFGARQPPPLPVLVDSLIRVLLLLISGVHAGGW